MLAVEGGKPGAAGDRVPAVLVHPGDGHGRGGGGGGLTVLYSHGNAEDIGLLVATGMLQEMSTRLGASVFAYDYVGYSTSRLEGAAPSEVAASSLFLGLGVAAAVVTSESLCFSVLHLASSQNPPPFPPLSPPPPRHAQSGCLRAVKAAWDYLTEDLAIAPGAIVLYGRSIGSGPTVDLASRPFACNDIAGVNGAGVRRDFEGLRWGFGQGQGLAVVKGEELGLEFVT